MTDFEKAVSLSELTKAAEQCAKGVRYKASVIKFLRDNLCKCHRLRQDLLTGKYKISKYLQFIINEPKRRVILATRFRDRVWQKSMVNNGVREQLLKPLIYDNGACQRKKGVDFAVDRCICFLQKFYRTHGHNRGFYDHLDVKGYFPNTPHAESKKVVDMYVKDACFREHLHRIIDSFPDNRPAKEILRDPFGKRGTALGSEISQLLQLALPTHIDHAIKEQFRIRYYIRFNDDLLLISDSKEELNRVRQYIISEYAKLGLTITIKQRCARLSDGIHFLKRRIILTDTGKVIVKASAEKFGKERRKLRKLKRKLDAGETTMQKIRDHYQSARAGLSRCDEKVRVRNLDIFYSNLFGEDPPKPSRKRRKKRNAYRKTRSGCREARGPHKRAGVREHETEVLG